MIKKNERGLLVVISGPSGVGKNTICDRLVSELDNIWLSISMTSREKRGNEKDGVEYYFITKEEFAKKIENDELDDQDLQDVNEIDEEVKRKEEETNVILTLPVSNSKHQYK